MQLPLFPAFLEMPEASSTVDTHRATMAPVASGQRRRESQYASSPWTVGNHRTKRGSVARPLLRGRRKRRKKKSVPIGPSHLATMIGCQIGVTQDLFGEAHFRELEPARRVAAAG